MLLVNARQGSNQCYLLSIDQHVDPDSIYPNAGVYVVEDITKASEAVSEINKIGLELTSFIFTITNLERYSKEDVESFKYEIYTSLSKEYVCFSRTIDMNKIPKEWQNRFRK